MIEVEMIKFFSSLGLSQVEGSLLPSDQYKTHFNLSAFDLDHPKHWVSAQQMVWWEWGSVGRDNGEQLALLKIPLLTILNTEHNVWCVKIGVILF